MSGAWDIGLWRGPEAADCAARLARGVPVAALAHIDAPFARGIIASSVFPPKERERASRYRLERNRGEFLLARGIVRSVLACALGLPPEQVAFDGEPNSKPRIAAGTGPAIDVSISHSDGWVLCGFAADRAVGVDIEAEDMARDIESLASYVFTPRERHIFNALATGARRSFFYDAWRRKEAVLKAAGVGLSGNPHTLDVLGGKKDGTAAEREIVIFQGRAWRVETAMLPGAPALALALGRKARSIAGKS